MKAFIFTPDVGRMKWLAGRTTAGADTTQIDTGMGVP